MLNITKKIYPIAGEKRAMLSKLAHAISADRSAALFFQFIEMILEGAAVYAIMQLSLAYLAPNLGGWGQVFSAVAAVVCAFYIQQQFSNSLNMAVVLEEDKALAAKLDKTKNSYRRSRWVVCFFAAALNTVGGYILATKATFKADLSSVERLESEHKKALSEINNTYKSDLQQADGFDDRAASSKATWTQYAAANPTEKSYAALKGNKEQREILERKTKLIESAAARQTSFVKAENDSYERRRAALLDAAKSETSKQFFQEMAALLGSTVFSIALLSMVWVFHTRAARHELICGIKIEVQMPSNEEQSMVGSGSFLVRFVLNGFAQSVFVMLYKAADWAFRWRLNLSGHGDTVEHKAMLKTNAKEAQKQAMEAAKKQVERVPMEIEEGEEEQAEEEEIEATPTRSRPAAGQISSAQNYADLDTVSTVFTTANTRTIDENSANTANTANNKPAANSANSVESANSENSEDSTANSRANTANTSKGAFNFERWKAEQAAKMQPSQTPQNDEQGEVELSIEKQVQQERAARVRANNAAANKSNTSIEIGGKEYTLRDLEQHIRVNKKRANDENASAEARARNLKKAEQMQQIIELHNQKQQA